MSINEDLYLYIQESEKAKHILINKLRIEISDLEFQIALGEELGYDAADGVYIIPHRLTAEKMIELLEDHDFNVPLESISIEFDKSVLPEDLPRRLDEKKIKVHGEIWKVHKYDKDQCPSNPHAHNVETGYKLHLGNGQLFDSKCKFLNSSISRRDLISIREKLNGWTLPPLSV